MTTEISLDQALRLLVSAHTAEHPEMGFVVHMGGPDRSRFSQAQYVEAWETVRAHLGLPTEPRR
jgi:hypothetical protein